VSEVPKVRTEMRAFVQGAYCPDEPKLKAKLLDWADRLEREPAVQKVAGVKRTPEQIMRDQIRILETKIGWPHLKLQEISDRSQMNNIGRVSECLNWAKANFATNEEALQSLRERVAKRYRDEAVKA
jgi:hypothetical protein